MTVPSVSMKSAFGMVHPAPVNGGDLALGLDHVTLLHLAILLIALAAVSHILQRERARNGRSGQCRTPSPASSGSLGGAMIPKPAVRAIRLGISAEQPLAVCRATAASPETAAGAPPP